MGEQESLPVRNLVLILGDQLNAGSAAFDGFDLAADAVWMAEVPGEAEHVWHTKPHIAIFLSAMRHFRDRLRTEGIQVHYRLPGSCFPQLGPGIGCAGDDLVACLVSVGKSLQDVTSVAAQKPGLFRRAVVVLKAQVGDQFRMGQEGRLLVPEAIAGQITTGFFQSVPGH